MESSPTYAHGSWIPALVWATLCVRGHWIPAVGVTNQGGAVQEMTPGPQVGDVITGLMLFLSSSFYYSPIE